MCGVVAIAGARRSLDSALDALAHRGPDGRGVWTSPECSLGHTRLAVVDPVGGAQPIANEDGSIIAVVNGEIYGTHDLRGHVLRSRCDAELLVHLYEEHGEDVVNVVRGELAFVLWDARRHRLLAGRDRFGIKPLVWSRLADGSIGLASEAKALFALGVPARWDSEAFFHAAHVQYTWPDRTLFEGVHQLEPGHTLAWQAGELSIRRYYTPRPSPATIRDALDEAVRLRLRADAKVCTQLSGGLDSTTVAALARTPCFTVSFTGGGEYDERAITAASADALGLPLLVVDVDVTTLATTWPDAVAHGEGLAINGHIVGKFLLSRAMRDAGYKVALTGEGSDEVFAGYPHLRTDAGVTITGHTASRGVMLPSEPRPARDRFVPTWLVAKSQIGARVHSLLAPDLLRTHSDIDPLDALLDRLAIASPGFAGARSTPEGSAESIDGLEPLRAAQSSWKRTGLAGYILKTLGDGMEMRHSIEGRVPFLDHHVVEAALSIPVAELAGHDIDKPVLRTAVADIVPPHILSRPKHPFLAPPLSRLAPSLVQDTLRAHARRSSLVDSAALVDLLDRLPAMTADDQQRWDPALMLLLSAAILEARYCR
jgi:asparagine synthase (glutamine-hydrolysing)